MLVGFLILPQCENLQKDLESKSIVKVCGAYDSMSAKLVELYGFDAVWAGVLQFQQPIMFQMQAF